MSDPDALFRAFRTLSTVDQAVYCGLLGDTVYTLDRPGSTARATPKLREIVSRLCDAGLMSVDDRGKDGEMAVPARVDLYDEFLAMLPGDPAKFCADHDPGGLFTYDEVEEPPKNDQ